MNLQISEIRTKFNLSQEKLGAKLGITRAAISRIESGKNALTESNIKLISSEFGVSENWLRTGEGEMFEPMDEEEELFALFGDMIKNKPEMKKIIRSMLKMSDEEGLAFIGAITNLYDALCKK